MPDHKGHKAESDVEPETHESRSRAAKGKDDGSHVGALVLTTLSMPAKRVLKREAKAADVRRDERKMGL